MRITYCSSFYYLQIYQCDLAEAPLEGYQGCQFTLGEIIIILTKSLLFTASYFYKTHQFEYEKYKIVIL